MDTPERLEQIAELLRDNGYDVQGSEQILEQYAQRLRNNGYTVTKRDRSGDPAPQHAGTEPSFSRPGETMAGAASPATSTPADTAPAEPGDGDAAAGAPKKSTGRGVKDNPQA